MGLMRKTASIATLGIIPFRSRKERMRAAESAAEEAERLREEEHEARVEADRQAEAAARRAEKAESDATHAEKTKRRHARRAARKARLKAKAEGLAHRVDPDLGGRSQRAGKKARQAGHSIVDRTKHRVIDLRDKAGDLVSR